MTTSLATTGYLIPEERALAMVETCARQLAEVQTIPDILKVVTQADAIAAVMHKIKATKKAQKAALRLRIEAEAQLGRITAQMPQAPRGAAAVPGQPTKRKELARHGIHHYRAGVAERLAKVPPEQVAESVERVNGSGVYGVLNDLGLRKSWREYATPEKTARDVAYLADEAIALLERCVAAKQAPHAGTVVEMRSRLNNLRVQVR